MKMAQRCFDIKNDAFLHRQIDGTRSFLKELRQAARNRAQTDEDRAKTAEELLTEGKWLTVSIFFV